jgi:hypothetical protein
VNRPGSGVEAATEQRKLHMPSNPLIRLYDLTSWGVVISFPSGVLYSNQTGGYACLQPEEEGVFVPLSNEIFGQMEMLVEYFSKKLKGACASGISIETADYLDHVLSLNPATRFLKIDRRRLSDSHEAWIYIDIFLSNETSEIISGFQGYKGVLTWPNSD